MRASIQGLFGAAGSREPLGNTGCQQRPLQGSGLVVAIVRQVGLRIPQGIGDGQDRQANCLAEVGGVGIEIWGHHHLLRIQLGCLGHALLRPGG
jgi:hypothetical protein